MNVKNIKINSFKLPERSNLLYWTVGSKGIKIVCLKKSLKFIYLYNKVVNEIKPVITPVKKYRIFLLFLYNNIIETGIMKKVKIVDCALMNGKMLLERPST